MSIVSKSIQILRMAAAILLLPLLASSCRWVTDDYDDETADVSNAANYINITVSISAASSPVTRAPLGGEYGDGWEKGNDNENYVKDITLIFFKDAAGVNTTNTNTEVLYVKKYDVHEATLDDYYYPSDYYYHTHKDTEPKTGYYNQEVVYTTGDQPLEENTLEAGETYQVLVVANADPNVEVHNKIVDVRDKVLNVTYDGTGTNATNFVMTSETDARITLKNPTVISNENKAIYYFDCIHMERMAARIDFWAKNSNGYKTSYATPGYEYTVKKPNGNDSNDRFVLTRITPFNLNNGDEYMLKRTNDANPYLANETTSNWVVDPNTSGKNGSAHPNYIVSPLASVVSTFTNDYTVTMEDKHTSAWSINERENFIVAYTKENTLQSDATTPLYYYATGLAFEGYYYAAGETTGSRRIYYYFIRHQGESNDAYNTWTPDNINDAKTTVCPSTPAMNFGIVRNNIYRISIETITEDAKIKVKMWDVFTHSAIYM